MQVARIDHVTSEDRPDHGGRALVAVGGQVAEMQRLIATRMGATAGGAWEIEALSLSDGRRGALRPIAIGFAASLIVAAATVCMMIA